MLNLKHGASAQRRRNSYKTTAASVIYGTATKSTMSNPAAPHAGLVFTAV